jgi:hypothetical protein
VLDVALERRGIHRTLHAHGTLLTPSESIAQISETFSCPSSWAPSRVLALPLVPYSVDRGQGDVRRTLLEEDEPLRDDRPHLRSESTSSLVVSLGGCHRSFLKVHPSSLRTARLMVATETQTPRFFSNIWRWSSKVAVSFSSSSDARAPSCGRGWPGGSSLCVPERVSG